MCVLVCKHKGIITDFYFEISASMVNKYVTLLLSADNTSKVNKAFFLGMLKNKTFDTSLAELVYVLSVVMYDITTQFVGGVYL